jgi:hypothetical protein
LRDGIDFDFSASPIKQLAPGARLLLVQNRAAFEFRYGVGLPIAGQYLGRLSNSGERVAIVDAADVTLFEITYGTVSPWPESPDGIGPSLELRDLSGNRSAPEHWQASAKSGGSPGLPVALNGAAIFDVSLVGNRLRLSINAEAGRTYHVLGASVLGPDAIWRHEQLAGPSSTNGELVVMLDMPPGTSARFYKALAEVP